MGVFFAGSLGAAARYLVDGLVQKRWNGAFPLGTLTVNLSGALLLGGLTGYLLTHSTAPPALRAVAGTGFVGAYTTFSTLTFESFRLLREGSRGYAAWNMLGSVGAGMLLAALGLLLGRSV